MISLSTRKQLLNVNKTLQDYAESNIDLNKNKTLNISTERLSLIF